MNKLRLFVALALVAVALLAAGAPTANAWGDEGHRFINLVAAQRLPDDMPGVLPKRVGTAFVSWSRAGPLARQQGTIQSALGSKRAGSLY